MPAESLYSHPPARGSSPESVHGRTNSLTSLVRPLGKARQKLQHLAQQTPFVRFIEDNDGQDKDENDIYRGRNPADQVFTFERWNKHRNSMRYSKHLLHMFTSRVFRQLLGPVLAVMALGLAVGVYETLVATGALPGHWPHVTLALGQGFNLTAFALSLLLVFRTNSSYDRWWEARKLWGGVVNRSRDIVRQSLVFFRDEDAHLRELLARWTMAFPRVLMCHLREDMDVAKEVAHLLTAHEVTVMCAAAHRPNFVLQVMAEVVRVARPNELCRMRMDDNLTFFEDAMGSCERILRTPIPLSYTRHTSRFLLVWLILLPFTLWAAYSWFSILLSGIFAFLMFGIDEIGVQIEEPFGILPLEAIGATIERNIRELMARSFDVTGLVQAQNVRGDVSELAGSDVAAVLALGEEFEFGEMRGAAPEGSQEAEYNSQVDAKWMGAAASGGGAPFISLTATTSGQEGGSSDGASPASGGRQAPDAPRRVQFGSATVIEMEGRGGGAEVGSSGGGRSGSPSRQGVPGLASVAGVTALHRRASLVEVELASGASPALSPRDGAGGSSFTWLHD
ncbi:hypothetical protein D9Q98_007038 [Chlorella vulgaris]|uniref:Uncharacterized protein n=1 Tax=Chlorella vulgaris TaxID=3077 RepID=A0A9D4YUJ9_CHLVU|nr:hypothetical protein D9Q98_007038 [Chlorella vulgaris]